MTKTLMRSFKLVSVDRRIPLSNDAFCFFNLTPKTALDESAKNS
jgi:hypothetical protein